MFVAITTFLDGTMHKDTYKDIDPVEMRIRAEANAAKEGVAMINVINVGTGEGYRIPEETTDAVRTAKALRFCRMYGINLA